jgi:hypothetical protein
MTLVMVLGPLVVAVVGDQAHHLSEVAAGCSGAEGLRAVTTLILTTMEVDRLVAALAGVVRSGVQAVVRATGIPTIWSGWLPFRRVSLTFGRNSRPHRHQT